VPAAQLERTGELSVDDIEESRVLSQPMKRRRGMRGDPSAFKDAFKDTTSSESHSVVDVPNR
jgi:hypothetical protein